MGFVLLAILVMQGKHDLLIRVIGADVITCVLHAILWRELAAVKVALVGKKGHDLMEQHRVLSLLQLTGLPIADATGGFVMPEGLAGGFHVTRPALQVLALLHVLGIAQEHLLVIIDVGAEVSLMGFAAHPSLLDDGQ